MKYAIVVIALFCASCAFAQTYGTPGVLSNQAVGVIFASNPRHATEVPMAREQSLLTGTGFMYAKGERPLWEFGNPKNAVSLGEVARQLKKDHESAKKAEVVWTN
jgi:hypothetical protein